TETQMDALRTPMRIRPGHEWDNFEGLTGLDQRLLTILDKAAAAASEQQEAPAIEVPDELAITISPVMSTQAGFGALLNEIGRQKSTLAERLVTAPPDLTVSTNLGPWVNRPGLFAQHAVPDTLT